MGMYDEIQINFEMPDSEVQDKVFQTKCLDSVLQRYRVDKDGDLYLYNCEREWVDDEDHFLGGHYKEIKSWESKVDLTGKILAYTNYGPDWYEYELVFENGSVVDISRIVEDEDL
jgi:hypothetical protein